MFDLESWLALWIILSYLLSAWYYLRAPSETAEILSASWRGDAPRVLMLGMFLVVFLAPVYWAFYLVLALQTYLAYVFLFVASKLRGPPQ